ncbi:hypothetical protein CN918_28830 [Priestia megaterium]|nr:hypothetical protein CN918_28830 [Priestia megaterium]
MKTIQAVLPDFSWNRVKGIHNLQIAYPTENRGDSHTLLSIQFLYINGNEKYDVLFYFHHPRSFSFETSGEHHQVSLTINNMKERGWEGISYEVEDYEEQALHFFCSDIEFIHAEKLM